MDVGGRRLLPEGVGVELTGLCDLTLGRGLSRLLAQAIDAFGTHDDAPREVTGCDADCRVSPPRAIDYNPALALVSIANTAGTPARRLAIDWNDSYGP